MLIQTKRYSDLLLSVGFKKGEFKVRTPYSQKMQGWDKTKISIRNEEKLTEEVIAELVKELIIKRYILKFAEKEHTFYMVEVPGYKEGKARFEEIIKEY